MMPGLKIVLIVCFLGSGVTGRSQDTIDLYPAQKGSLICWTENRTVPRQLKIHYLRVDLKCRNLEVFTMAGEDPDGDGPAESMLTPPNDLVIRNHALAAINSNAFAGLPGTENDIRGWYKYRPVDIHGMAVKDSKVISPVEKGRTSFWIDSGKSPHLVDPKPGEQVWQAVSDWSCPLIINNRIMTDSTVTTLHPRSALGFDDTGKWLLLVVVDGRQPGFSEGISLHELALLFRSKGCTQSINLDGGGSSTMLIRQANGAIHTVNSPSGLLPRPIAVMLGVRQHR